jgi:hypothetical protein
MTRTSTVGGSLGALLITSCAAAGGERPKVLLTGYWPPSNEAIRRFSTNPVQNPQGWIGENWEGRGYDVVSYFPEFLRPNCGNCGKGTGDLEVDYQDTSNDFWAIANEVRPVAIITFSRGFPNVSWEAEMNQFNRAAWFPDYLAPTTPNPSPPDASVPAGALRLSTLPVEAIVAAVEAAAPSLDAYICFTQDGGGFLSEFIAYHGVWYQSLHADPNDPDRCVAAGHVHVGGQIPWPTAQIAAAATLRAVLDYVDSILVSPGDLDGDGLVGSADLAVLLAAFGPCPLPACTADLDSDGLVGPADLALLLGNWS